MKDWKSNRKHSHKIQNLNQRSNQRHFLLKILQKNSDSLSHKPPRRNTKNSITRFMIHVVMVDKIRNSYFNFQQSSSFTLSFAAEISLCLAEFFSAMQHRNQSEKDLIASKILLLDGWFPIPPGSNKMTSINPMILLVWR